MSDIQISLLYFSLTMQSTYLCALTFYKVVYLFPFRFRLRINNLFKSIVKIRKNDFCFCFCPLSFPFEDTTTKRNKFETNKQKEKYFLGLSKVNPLKSVQYAYARRQKDKRLNINKLEKVKISLIFFVFAY